MDDERNDTGLNPADDGTDESAKAGIFRPTQKIELAPVPNKRLLIAGGVAVTGLLVASVVLAGRQGVVDLPVVTSDRMEESTSTTERESFLVSRVDPESSSLETPLTSSTSAGPFIDFTPIDVQRSFPPPRLVTDSGRLELLGTIASEQEAERIGNRLEGAFGADRVSNQLVIDPRAPVTSSLLMRIVDPPPFLTQSRDLSTAVHPVLDGVIELFANDRRLTVTVEGHADELGDADEDARLSAERADAVAAYLIAGGVDKGRIAVVGQGSRQPIDELTTPEGRQRNRRIDLEISGIP